MDRALLESGLTSKDRTRILWPVPGGDKELLELEAQAVRIGALGDGKALAEALLAAVAPRMVQNLVRVADDPEVQPGVRVQAADKALQRAGIGVPKLGVQAVAAVQIVFEIEGRPPQVLAAKTVVVPMVEPAEQL